MEATDVLVIEDDAQVGRVLCELLEVWGYTAVWAGSAEAGWTLFGRLAPRAVVTDNRMPGDGGLSLARRLKVLETDTPVVMLSGDPPADAGEVCDAVLAKPAGAMKLRETLEALGVAPREQ